MSSNIYEFAALIAKFVMRLLGWHGAVLCVILKGEDEHIT